MEIGGPVVACVADLAFKYAGVICFQCILNTNSALFFMFSTTFHCYYSLGNLILVSREYRFGSNLLVFVLGLYQWCLFMCVLD